MSMYIPTCLWLLTKELEIDSSPKLLSILYWVFCSTASPHNVIILKFLGKKT